MFAAALLLAFAADAGAFDADAVRAQSRTLTLAGNWERALALLDAAEARPGAADPRAKAALAAERGRVLMDMNFFHHRDPAPARAALEEAQRLAKAAKDRMVAADVAQSLGQLSYSAGFETRDWKTPRSAFEKVLAEREKLADRRGLAETLFYLGLTYEQDGQPAPALERYQKSLAIAEEAGDLVQQSYARRHIAGIQEERGEYPAAEKNIAAEIDLRRRGGFAVGVPFALLQQADFVAARGGDPKEIERLLDEAIAAAESCGSTRALYSARAERSRRASADGDSRTAFTMAEKALEAARAYGGASEIQEARALVGDAGRRLPN